MLVVLTGWQAIFDMLDRKGSLRLSVHCNMPVVRGFLHNDVLEVIVDRNCPPGLSIVRQPLRQYKFADRR